MKKIWLVYGKSGEYSDRKEWVVGACVEERDAAKAVRRLKRECSDALQKYCSNALPSWDMESWFLEQGFLDAQNLYNGWYSVEYGYYEVNILDSE